MMICDTCKRNVYRNWNRALRDYDNTYRHSASGFSTCGELRPVPVKPT